MSALVCDGCDATIIVSTHLTGRALLAEAQLNRGAVATGGKVYCQTCRLERTKTTGNALKGAHSIGTRAPTV